MSYVFVILIRIDKGMNNEISNSLYHVPIFQILTIDWKDKRIKLVYKAIIFVFIDLSFSLGGGVVESVKFPLSWLTKDVFILFVKTDSAVLRASKFSVLKFTKIVILWVYYTIPFGFSLFLTFWASVITF